MASSAKFFSFILLLTISSAEIHGRESEFFSRFGRNYQQQQSELPTTQVPALTKQDQQPDFLPQATQNAYGYGLFSNEPAQLAPNGGAPPTYPSSENSQKSKSGEPLYRYRDASTTPAANGGATTYASSENSQQLKSGEPLYRYRDTTTPAANGGASTYASSENSQQSKPGEPLPRYRAAAAAAAPGAENSYNGVNGYETQKKGVGETRLTGRQTNYWNNAGDGYSQLATGGFNGRMNTQQQQQKQQRQGMSDTRYIANGRFYYDVNADRSSDNGNRKFRTNNAYGNSNAIGFSNGNGYNSDKQSSSKSNGSDFYTPNGRESYQSQTQIQEKDEEFVP
ncbi:protein E6-like [Malania oleifera]|uniref:protein E6-like n=1 Tax=Malania oleifera TaxID=397392 RepID=UPI0025ADC3E0|nr:protein E6-like [Malania oleifera]